MITDRLVVTLALAVVCVVPARASAQESVPVTSAAKASVRLQSPWLSTLRVAAARGDSDHLGAVATEFLKDLAKSAEPAITRVCCDLDRRFYLVVFTTTDMQGKQALTHVLVHNPPARTLPGLDGPNDLLYEVFVAEDPSVTITGWYDVERVENPAVKQLGDFAAAVIPKVVLPTASNISTEVNRGILPLDGGQRPTYPHSIEVLTVELPYARAKLTARHTVLAPDPVGHLRAVVANVALEMIVDRSSDFADALAGRVTSAAKGNGCTPLVTGIRDKLLATFAGDACRLTLSDPAECLKLGRTDLAALYKAFTPTATCSAGQGRSVALGFEAALSNPGRVTGTTALTNAPPQRFSFGLAFGYLASVDTDSAAPRAVIQSGKIAPSPFTRSVAMATVNLPLWGYDPNTFEPTAGERFRPFVAIPFTPYLGLGAGGSVLVTRVIAVNAGYLRLFYDTPKANEAFDAAPVNKTNPFTTGHAGAWFVAAGVNFK